MHAARGVDRKHRLGSRYPGRALLLLAALLATTSACGAATEGGSAQEEAAAEETAEEESSVGVGIGSGGTTAGGASSEEETETDGGTSPAEDAAGPTTDGGEASSSDPTDPEDSTSPPEGPSTDEAAPTGCHLPGRWRLRSDEFLASLPSTRGSTTEHVSGTYDLVLQEGSRARMERAEWSLRSQTAEGAIRVTISDLETGTWTAGSGTITLDLVTEYTDVALALETGSGLTPIPGGTFNDVDVDANIASASYRCDGRELALETAGITTRWVRVS